MRGSLLDALKERVIVADGAMGTMLYAKGIFLNRCYDELNLSQPLVSHHLKELKRSLLVKIERNGPFIYYELVDPRILDVIRTLSIVATDLLTARRTF